MFYVVTWGLFSANTDLRFVLAANDFNTIVGLGIVVALWKGDSYDERHTLANLLFLFGLLFSWNFVSLSLGFSVKTWIFPSMTLSLVFISSAAVVVCVRFRSVAAIAFAVVSAVYLLMQLPSYQIVFAKTNADPELLKLLGLAKLAYGGSFFVAFFQPVEGLERALRFRLPFASARLKAALSNPLIVAVLGGVLTELLLMAGKGIWHLITGHPVA
jgi:hypothetical protein